MNKIVYLSAISLTAVGCVVVHARTAHTGHLLVSLTDREIGGPITNATVSVRVQTKLSYVGHSTPSRYFRTETAHAGSNGVANVEFQFYYPDFDWWVRSPTHYCHRYRLGARKEWLGCFVEQSDYLHIDTNTVQGLAMYNELVQLENNNDYFGLVAKFNPKSVTYTNNVVVRSASFFPKRNPQPMYTYGPGAIDYLPMKDPTVIMTNGLEIARFKPVDFDLRKGLVVSYKPNHDDFWDGPAGDTADFHIERFRVTTNNVETAYGWIEFAPGCGAYKRNTTGDESFPTTYEAETNATFVSRISYEISRINGKDVVYAKQILDHNEYMVLRTRVTTNEVGEVVSCNYSKILGPMAVADPWHPSDFVEFQSLVFNPRPNDINLEANLSTNLATRGDGSWYP